MSRCPLCPGVNVCLGIDGPPSRYLFIGEAPGHDENRRGRVFVGRVGQEVDQHYLRLAGMDRRAVTFMNAIACYPPSTGGKLDPKQPKDLALLASCAAHHLYPTIERMRPEVLIPLGSFACRAINPDIDLELQHGIPTTSRWGIPVFPMFHPAGGLHEPKKMLLLRNDWIRLKAFTRGALKLPVDAYPRPDYAELTDPDELDAFCDDPRQPLAADTETKKDHAPYCLTFTTIEGAARLIRAERTDLLTRFQFHLNRWHGPVLFHNWLFDRKVTRAMGLQIRDAQIVDTMLYVFHLGNLPQGLKALAFRELGMRMQDFNDVVRPHSTLLVLNYLAEALERTWPKPEEQLIRGDDGKWKAYKPQGMNTKLKRFFTDYGKNDTKDVFQAWENWSENHAMMEAELGPFPGLCITHAPFEDALHYACRDADAVRRLWPVIQRMRKRVRKTTQDQWRAA